MPNKKPSSKEKIRRILTAADGFVSGEKLSEQLQISRTAVWKAVHALMDEGYRVESVTNKGYRLLSAPDIISGESLLPLLHTEALGRSLYTYQTIDSTNTEAKRRAMEGAVHGSVFTSEEQTLGKGRLGRRWVSEPGAGLWFTLLLRPHCSPAETAGLTLVTGLAVCRALRRLYALDARIKWPNDIVVGSKKLCGILLEMSTEEARVDYVAAGIGINVNAESFPDEIAYKATSLRILCGRPVRRAELLAAILDEFEPLYALHEAHRMNEMMDDYRRLCVTLGREISAERPDGLLKGIGTDITPEGELVIRTADGALKTIFTGEVSVQGIYDPPKAEN